MKRWTRRLLTTVLVLAVLLLPAWWLLVRHSPAPGAQTYALDLPTLRLLADALPGAKPVEVRYEHVADFEFAEAMVVAGDPWKKTLLPVYAYQVVFPDRTLMIDGALDRASAAPRSLVPMYDETAYGRVVAALERAALIVVTHEHVDHIGGIVTHPRLRDLRPALRLTETQLAHAELMKPAVFPDGVMTGYRGLRYEGAMPLAPGVVLLRAPGHTPGSQMVYVQRADGRELLFIGDVAWHQRSIDLQRERPLFMTLIIGEDRSAVLAQFAALRQLAAQAPALRIVPGHDGPVVQALTAAGELTAGFRP